MLAPGFAQYLGVLEVNRQSRVGWLLRGRPSAIYPTGASREGLDDVQALYFI
jgi:hypothetical protein